MRRQRDPLGWLAASNQGRVPELVPLRHGRMLASPLAFYRGAASLMAHDLAALPHSGVMTQLCGDAHLANFGFFASPERSLLFDINDFDETLPGPFDWDLRRLATSFVIAGARPRLQGAHRQRCGGRTHRGLPRPHPPLCPHRHAGGLVLAADFADPAQAGQRRQGRTRGDQEGPAAARRACSPREPRRRAKAAA